MIIENLKNLSSAINKKQNWESIVFLPDHPESVNKWGINAINVIDPWKVKLSLMDLEKVFTENNKEIGAVIIIGNHS